MSQKNTQKNAPISEEILWEWLSAKPVTMLKKVLDLSAGNPVKFFRVLEKFYLMTREQYRRKNMSADAHADMELLSDIRLATIQKKRRRRAQPIARRVERQFSMIKTLRKEGASWDDVRVYLSQHHALDVSKSYLCKTMKKLGYVDESD